ncbi:hypothetical protein [Halosegnis marinus]|uniref:Uncharacterized protein n=1 Tax=Halosegnis marinus TaxID=3034023 RepID=A0ABD5ZPC2_9EURY|nr:hypothetical protein [Halosegnis sp. DT85]
MSYGREPSERAPEPEGTPTGPLGAAFDRLKRHLVEWPARCVETQVRALEGER